MTEQMTDDKVQHLLGKLGQLKNAIHQVIVGQEEVLDQLIVGLIASGHVLLEGVPGLAKTLMIRTLSQALDLNFKRIQFTPDLMPADILGTEILQSDQDGHKFFKFTPGPVFTNILLADEINRTPPKTQSALLELMQEYAITHAGKRYDLPQPFFLLATQNPIEQSGTFPLPEAQVDRFLLYVKVEYPTATEEEQILHATTGKKQGKVTPVYNAEEIIALQQLCREVHIDQSLVTLVTQIVRNSRPKESPVAMVTDYVDWGAGPRAGQALILASKAYALLQGRYSVIPSDISQMLLPALQHRIILNFRAASEEITPTDVLNEIYKASQ